MPLTMCCVDLECDRCGKRALDRRVRTRQTAFGEEVVDLGRSRDSKEQGIWMLVNGVLACPDCLEPTHHGSAP